MAIPKGKYAWTVKVGEKGQFVIPKEAREIFNIKPGDTLIVLADEKQGIDRKSTRLNSSHIPENDRNEEKE